MVGDKLNKGPARVDKVTRKIEIATKLRVVWLIDKLWGDIFIIKGDRIICN